MAVLKYKDSNGNYQPLVGINVQCEVVQTTGTSTTAVMSQKAVTDELGGKSDKTATVSDVSFDSSTNKLQKTIDGTTSDVCEILKKDGFYEDLHSGLADNLFGETQTSDRFLFRPTAGIQDIESGEPPVGGAAVRRIEGSAVAWNQLIHNVSSTMQGWVVRGGSVTVNNDVITFTVDSVYSEVYDTLIGDYTRFIDGHKYYASININPAHTKRLRFYAIGTGPNLDWGFPDDAIAGQWNKCSTIMSPLGYSFPNVCEVQFALNCTGSQGYSSGDVDYIKNINLIDLTLLFGAGNEPETAAAFEQWLSENIGLKSYYPYNAGELIPVKDYKVKAVGFNAWDASKRVSGKYINYSDGSENLSVDTDHTGFVHVIGGKTYYLLEGNGGDGEWGAFYDSNKQYISGSNSFRGLFTVPNDACYVRISLHKEVPSEDICINLSYDDDKDGTYEEHWEHETAVDVTTLKGKLNGTGSSVVVFPDGLKKVGSIYDEIIRRGEHTIGIKRIGALDIGTESWNLESDYSTFYISGFVGKKTGIRNVLCGKYVTSDTDSLTRMPDKSVSGAASNFVLQIKDSTFSTTSDFETAMSGVMLYYELATPQEYILDDDILPMQYAVDDYGTEELLLGNDSSVVSCTPKMSIKYGINAADTIASLPHSYVSSKHQSLNDSEQETARQNIGAASQHDMTVVKKQLELIDKKVENDYYVDMGLPSGVLWAKRNIDITQADKFAASQYQYECSFFSWGNTDGHNPTNTTTFSYNWGNSNDVEPYVSSNGAKLTGNIPLSQDAVRHNLGEPWRMPTTEEFKELFDNCDFIDASGNVIASTTTNKLVTMSSVVGIRLKSKINGKILFFPCSGNGNGASWDNRGSFGHYWASSLYSSTHGRGLYFSSGGVYPQDDSSRYDGFSVRPVM